MHVFFLHFNNSSIPLWTHTKQKDSYANTNLTDNRNKVYNSIQFVIKYVVSCIIQER